MFSKVPLQCQTVSWPTAQNVKERNSYWIGFQKSNVASDPRMDTMLPYTVETFDMLHCALIGLWTRSGRPSEVIALGSFPTQGFSRRNTLRERGGKNTDLLCWFQPCCAYTV